AGPTWVVASHSLWGPWCRATIAFPVACVRRDRQLVGLAFSGCFAYSLAPSVLGAAQPVPRATERSCQPSPAYGPSPCRRRAGRRASPRLAAFAHPTGYHGGCPMSRAQWTVAVCLFLSGAALSARSDAPPDKKATAHAPRTDCQGDPMPSGALVRLGT